MPLIARFPEGPGRWRTDALSELPCIRPGCTVRDSRLGAWTELMAGTTLCDVNLGDYSYVAGDAEIVSTDIGRFSSLARGVRINPGNHPMERPTQHHCTYRRKAFGFADSDDAAFFAWRADQRVTIGHDVWLGHGAIIMPGIAIGTGAVIGAGAVVTKDVPDYAIAVGVPAKVIRYRFPPETIAGLTAIAWWNWDRATLQKHFADLCGDTAAFIARFSRT